MAIIRNPSGGPKSRGTAGKTAARGIDTMNTQGAPLRLGVNPNKGMPNVGNVSGDRGGMPGVRPNNGGGKQRLRDVHMSQPGSGHDMKASRRASMTGYSEPLVTDKAPGKVKAGPGTIGSTGGRRGYRGGK